MIRGILGSTRLLLGNFDFGDDEVRIDRAQLRRLLGAITYQAMHDGMSRVRIGVADGKDEPFMQYFGPIDDDEEKRKWWDMVPPPSACYPLMLQICLSLAEVEASLPIRGAIPALLGKERLSLQFVLEELESFEISWENTFALRRLEGQDV